MTIRFITKDTHGIEVTDSIENRRCLIQTTEDVDPTDVSDSPFSAPVDAAVRIVTDEIAFEPLVGAYIRDGDGAIVGSATPATGHEIEDREWTVELSGPIKLYFRLSAPGRVITDLDRLRIECEEPASIVIGARSYHTTPATTITTTRDPADLVRVLSTFGTALKTTTCERSFPTLRGHPPAIELGDELAIPSELQPPETGVRIEIPPTLDAVFAIAPLAFYLGAIVRTGETARIVTDTGFTYDFGSEGRDEHGNTIGSSGMDDSKPNRTAVVERGIERVLKQVLFLDCLTRSDGPNQTNLHERNVVEPHVDLDFETVYDQPLSSQLEAYLSIPYEMIEDHIPTWNHTAYVDPSVTPIEVIPYLVDELSIVRTRDSAAITLVNGQHPDPNDHAETVGGISPNTKYADGETSTTAENDTAVATNTTAETNIVDVSTGYSTDAESTPIDQRPRVLLPVVSLPPTDSIGRSWFGNGIPIGATKGSVRGYRNRLARDAPYGPIEIAVVCNDRSMTVERSDVTDCYGSRTDLPFDVTVHSQLSVDELRGVVTADIDFLHYIGHIDDEGFLCRDGQLDVTALDAVGVDAFLLNACWSIRQGLALVDRGSIGGIVTVNDVIDGSAVRMGYAIARLLELGFPLRAALRVARSESAFGDEYVIVGDATVDLAQERTTVPTHCLVEEADDDFDVTIRTYLTREGGMGAVVHPYIDSVTEYFLPPGTVTTVTLSKATFEEYVDRYPMAVSIDGTLVWETNGLELP